MQISTLDSLQVEGRAVLVRVDFNCPLQDGKVSDDNRILAALPTLNRLLDAGARLVLMSHLGRPSGSGYEEKFSLAPVAERLSELIERPVAMASDCVGEAVEQQVRDLPNGGILLLENLRFHKEEKKNDPEFAARLASLADVYVNDAFGAAHRAHASTEAVASLLPSAAGLLMERELGELGRLLEEPKRPFVAILGGAKVTDKIGVLKNLAALADTILIGGGMAFTFLKLTGHEIGKSLCEEDLELSGRVWKEANAQRAKVLLPTDVAIAPEFAPTEERHEVPVTGIPSDQMGLDIGAGTIEAFSDVIATAGTVFWNGPMGVFEMKPFDEGTLRVAQALAASGAQTCVGGGDSAAAVRRMGLDHKVTHMSTGGGASLEFLEGRALPGVEALRHRTSKDS